MLQERNLEIITWLYFFAFLASEKILPTLSDGDGDEDTTANGGDGDTETGEAINITMWICMPMRMVMLMAGALESNEAPE
jgi:hypothetical protein